MTNPLNYGRGLEYYTMKTVQPIRDEKKIEAMKKILNRRKSITRQQAYNIINYAAEFAGVEEAVGTHTLRKTFGIMPISVKWIWLCCRKCLIIPRNPLR